MGAVIKKHLLDLGVLREVCENVKGRGLDILRIVAAPGSCFQVLRLAAFALDLLRTCGIIIKPLPAKNISLPKIK